ncbi:hypothetical protein [Marinobacter sp.]|uniref:hypothetical protein n=1 Tax=Marinobacter sp. TaxID=50741 RepID=UPI002630B887|nr:hypothetical protein [Marinobacter sp.]
MKQALPLAVVGFMIGAAAGFAWGRKAKSNIGDAVRTDVSGGVVTVQFDSLQAARSGLADEFNNLIDRL